MNKLSQKGISIVISSLIATANLAYLATAQAEITSSFNDEYKVFPRPNFKPEGALEVPQNRVYSVRPPSYFQNSTWVGGPYFGYRYHDGFVWQNGHWTRTGRYGWVWIPSHWHTRQVRY